MPNTSTHVLSVPRPVSAASEGDHVGRTQFLGILPELRSRLRTAMTPEDRTTLLNALALPLEPDEDVLMLWEAATGRPRLQELANIFRESNAESAAAAVVDEWMRQH